MSKIDERSILDFFLLAVMDDGGMTTPYDLMKGLGVSPGASIPALRRLQKQGLVARGRVGQRRRQAFTLTDHGDSLLNRELREALQKQVDASPLDPETISRIVSLAYSKNGSLDYAVQIVEAAMKKCAKKARAAREKVLPFEAKGHRGTYPGNLLVGFGQTGSYPLGRARTCTPTSPQPPHHQELSS